MSQEIPTKDSQIDLLITAIASAREAGMCDDERLACYLAGYLSKHFKNE